MTLTVVLREVGHRCVVLSMSGELDRHSALDLARAHGQANAGRPDTLVLDLTNVVHLDGDGVGLLASFVVRARQQGRTVRAAGLAADHRQLLALAGLDAAMPVHDCLEAACGPHIAREQRDMPDATGPGDRVTP